MQDGRSILIMHIIHMQGKYLWLTASHAQGIPHVRLNEVIQKGTSESTVRCNSRTILLAVNSPVLLRTNLQALQHVNGMYPRWLNLGKWQNFFGCIRQQSSPELAFPLIQNGQSIREQHFCHCLLRQLLVGWINFRNPVLDLPSWLNIPMGGCAWNFFTNRTVFIPKYGKINTQQAVWYVSFSHASRYRNESSATLNSYTFSTNSQRLFQFHLLKIAMELKVLCMGVRFFALQLTDRNFLNDCAQWWTE